VKPNNSLTVAEGNISGDLISGGDVNIIHRVLHRAGMFLPTWQCDRLATDRVTPIQHHVQVEELQ